MAGACCLQIPEEAVCLIDLASTWVQIPAMYSQINMSNIARKKNCLLRLKVHFNHR